MGAASLSRILQNLSFRYTRRVNGRRKCSGHLFQGRYKAVLVDADSYLNALPRYIHLNPVRAGIVKEAKEYRWSGHRAYLGLEKIPWLTTDWVLSQFSDKLAAARRIYEKYVAEEKGGGHQPEYHQGSATDSRGMAAWLVLESGAGTLVQLGRLTGRDPSTLSSAAKRLQRRAQKDLQLAKRMKQLLETSS